MVGVIRSLFSTYPDIGEILVVDDDSTDGTRTEINEHFSPLIAKEKVRIIHRKTDPGLTPSLRDGVSIARCDLVGWMDCDGSMPVEKIAELVASIGNGFDVAVASRFAVGGQQKSLANLGNDSWLEILLSNLLNRILHRIFRLPISDLTSGFIVLRKSLASRLTFQGRHGEYFIFLILEASRRGARMTEIPYTCGTRHAGHSKTFGSPKAVFLNSLRYTRAFLSALFASRRLAHDPSL